MNERFSSNQPYGEAPLKLRFEFFLTAVLANPFVFPRRAGGAAVEECVSRRDDSHRTRKGHNVMSPLEFMQRLAALVPRPRLHLIRFIVF